MLLPVAPVVLHEVAEETPVGKPGLVMYVLLKVTTLPVVQRLIAAVQQTPKFEAQAPLASPLRAVHSAAV
jgi:hypothetical protein